MYCKKKKKKKSENNTNINPGIFIWPNFKYSYDHQLDIQDFQISMFDSEFNFIVFSRSFS